MDVSFGWLSVIFPVLGAVLLSLTAQEGLSQEGEAQREPYVLVLGIAQDAGYPQAGCDKSCCRPAWQNPALRRHAASLGIIDPVSQQRWLIDATPDFKSQLRLLDEHFPVASAAPGLDGILLTHAHIGHYTGLMHLGREVMGAKQVPVYALPRMRRFLQKNGPWSLLVELGNISLRPFENGVAVSLNERISVTPFLVPHRDEFSETAGFLIEGPARRIAYLPDIDKWERWEASIEALLDRVDVAFLDGTFFANGEIPGRDMSQIPHPFIEESLARFANLPAATRKKIYFIHLNHTNPALQKGSAAWQKIREAGMHVAEEGMEIKI